MSSKKEMRKFKSEVNQKLRSIDESIQQVAQQTQPEPLLPHQEIAKKSKSKFMEKWNAWNSLSASRVKTIAGVLISLIVLFFIASGFIMDYINNAKDFIPSNQEVSADALKEDTSDIPEDIQEHLNAIGVYTKNMSSENASLKEKNQALTDENDALREENEQLLKTIQQFKEYSEQADTTAD